MSADQLFAAGCICAIRNAQEQLNVSIFTFATCKALDMQSTQEDVEDEASGRRPKRRSSNAGVQYSEDLSDAMFNRLMRADDQHESASEVSKLSIAAALG